MDAAWIANGLTWYLIFLFSTTLHEAAHAYTALKLGDPTAYEGGQVSLHPGPHIRREPFGMVVIPLLFYFSSGWVLGWASTPYDPRWAYTHPKRSAMMSLAGPLANLMLVLLAAGLIHAGIAAKVFVEPNLVGVSRVVDALEPGLWSAAAKALSVLFSLNLILFVFNLMPIPPMDGSGAVGLLLPDDLARGFSNLVRRPLVAIGGLLLAWYVFPRLFQLLHLGAIHLLYPWAQYQ